jgi:hypothetical protein
LLAHGQWFSTGTPASSTTKTGRHDIAEILLKVALFLLKENVNPRVLAKTYHFSHIIGQIINYSCSI